MDFPLQILRDWLDGWSLFWYALIPGAWTDRSSGWKYIRRNHGRVWKTEWTGNYGSNYHLNIQLFMFLISPESSNPFLAVITAINSLMVAAVAIAGKNTWSSIFSEIPVFWNLRLLKYSCFIWIIVPKNHTGWHIVFPIKNFLHFFMIVRSDIIDCSVNNIIYWLIGWLIFFKQKKTYNNLLTLAKIGVILWLNRW